MKLLDFENWHSGKLLKSANIWLSKLIFYVKNDSAPFLLKDIFLGAHFWLLTFFDNFNFKPLYFQKWRPIFDNFYSSDCKT